MMDLNILISLVCCYCPILDDQVSIHTTTPHKIGDSCTIKLQSIFSDILHWTVFVAFLIIIKPLHLLFFFFWCWNLFLTTSIKFSMKRCMRITHFSLHSQPSNISWVQMIYLFKGGILDTETYITSNTPSFCYFCYIIFNSLYYSL